jgi:hypothetical protein
LKNASFVNARSEFRDAAISNLIDLLNGEIASLFSQRLQKDFFNSLLDISLFFVPFG